MSKGALFLRTEYAAQSHIGWWVVAVVCRCCSCCICAQRHFFAVRGVLERWVVLIFSKMQREQRQQRKIGKKQIMDYGKNGSLVPSSPKRQYEHEGTHSSRRVAVRPDVDACALHANHDDAALQSHAQNAASCASYDTRRILAVTHRASHVTPAHRAEKYLFGRQQGGVRHFSGGAVYLAAVPE